ncbi:MAG TPA: hypothetical protein VEU47_11050 [Candidatus Cybelea sp.]|nr:hypothetical protein [Candidatus Cybelea sp.]
MASNHPYPFGFAPPRDEDHKTPGDFDGSREPLRALRDLIGDCECGAFEGNPDVLRRAQDAFTALRALFGDVRPAEDIAFAKMIEPSGKRSA